HVGVDGTYKLASRYTILTADGGIDGTFGAVTSDFAFLDPSLSYDSNNVYLKLVRNDIDFADVGSTPNQKNTGAAVDSLDPDSPIGNGIVGMDDDGARNAFDQLSGEAHASLKGMLIEDSRFVRDAAIDR